MIQLPSIYEFSNTEDTSDCAQFANKDGQRIFVWPITEEKDFFLRVFVCHDGYASYIIESKEAMRGALAEDFEEPEEAYRPTTEETLGLISAWGLKL